MNPRKCREVVGVFQQPFDQVLGVLVNWGHTLAFNGTQSVGHMRLGVAQLRQTVTMRLDMTGSETPSRLTPLFGFLFALAVPFVDGQSLR